MRCNRRKGAAVYKKNISFSPQFKNGPWEKYDGKLTIAIILLFRAKVSFLTTPERGNTCLDRSDFGAENGKVEHDFQ